MFHGFDSSQEKPYFQRRFGLALFWALLISGSSITWAIINAQMAGEAEEAEVIQDVEVQDLNFEEPEEEVPEEEPPDEPPPEPPPKNTKVVRTSKPPPPQEIVNPDEVTEGIQESDQEATRAVYGGPKRKTNPNAVKKEPKAEPKEEPKVEKPKPKKPKGLPFDPNEAQARLPDGAKPAKPGLSSKQNVDYPPDLRSQNITGRIVVRLLIDRKGNIKKMQILKKECSVKDDEKKAKWAIKKMMSAVAKTIKSWPAPQYKPATYDGIPITTWVKVTFPFRLK